MSSMSIGELLATWGLSPTIVKNFEEQEVTVANLPHLSEDSLRRLIPKEGPYCLFQQHLKALTNTVETEENAESNTHDSLAGAPFNQVKRRRLDNAQLQAILNITDVNDLQVHLKQSMLGVCVLGYFLANNRLDNHCRDILCEQAVYRELVDDYNKGLDREDFNRIADSIVELFPSESKETWYDVVRKDKATTVQGRLRHKYYAVRKHLRNALLIPSDGDGPTVSIVDSNQNFDALGEDSDDHAYMWLLKEKDPWKDVCDKWQETSVRRARDLNQSENVTSYLDKFPAFQLDKGPELLALDAQKGNAVFNTPLHTLWNDYSKFLVTLIQQEKTNFLKAYSSLSDEQKFVSILLELPYLFKVRPLPKSPEASSKSTAWRASRQEVQEALFLQATSIPEIQEKLKDRKKKLEKYHYPLQVIPVFLGPAGNIRQSFVVLDNYRWEVNSPFEAFETAFKITFGLGTQYPVEARHILLFLQRTLYQITTESDYSGDRGLRTCIAGRLKDFDLFSSKSS